MKRIAYLILTLSVISSACSPSELTDVKSTLTGGSESEAGDISAEGQEELAAEVLLQAALEPLDSVEVETESPVMSADEAADDDLPLIAIQPPELEDVASQSGENSPVIDAYHPIIKSIFSKFKNEDIVKLGTGILFKKVDLNTDGVVSQDELIEGISKLNVEGAVGPLSNIAQIAIPNFMQQQELKPNHDLIESWLKTKLSAMQKKLARDRMYNMDTYSKIYKHLKAIKPTQDMVKNHDIKKTPWMQKSKQRRQEYMVQRLLSKYYACAYEFKSTRNHQEKCENIVLTSEDKDLAATVRSKLNKKPIVTPPPAEPNPPIEDEALLCKVQAQKAEYDIEIAKKKALLLQKQNLDHLNVRTLEEGYRPAKIYDLSEQTLFSMYNVTTPKDQTVVPYTEKMSLSKAPVTDYPDTTVKRLVSGKLYKISLKPNIKLPASFEGPRNGYIIYSPLSFSSSIQGSLYYFSRVLGTIAQRPVYVTDANNTVHKLNAVLSNQVVQTIESCQLASHDYRTPVSTLPMPILNNSFLTPIGDAKISLHWFAQANIADKVGFATVKSEQKVIEVKTKYVRPAK